MLATNLLGGAFKRLRQANRDATGRITDIIGEVFGAAQAVKVASAEEGVIARCLGICAAVRNLTDMSHELAASRAEMVRWREWAVRLAPQPSSLCASVFQEFSHV